MSKTTQKLDETTLERLREHGKMGDSFDQVVNRLLDEVEDEDDGTEEGDDEEED